MPHYVMTPQLNRRILTLLGVLLVFAILVSMITGPLGWSTAVLTDRLQHAAVFNYRSCRTLLAIIAGSSLAASGASLQAIFRNPLADPHLFGISGGAALGAALVISFWSTNIWLAPSIGAILGGLTAFLFIFFYLTKSPKQSLSHCLLVGVLINSLAAALITLLKTILPPTKTQSLLYWLVGHISAVESSQLWFIIPAWLLGLAILIHLRGELEILSFGSTETTILGINAHATVKLAIIANCLLIGNVVAFAGMIGFLGLVIPHFVRLIIFPDLRFVLPAASFLGAIILVFFDTLSRLSFACWQTEIPVGALTALILSPVFFFLLLRGVHED
jgi:iron complex transport system permease protein